MSANPPTLAFNWTALATLLVKEVPALAAVPVVQLAAALPMLYLGGELLVEAVKKASEHMAALGWHLGFYPPGDANAKVMMLDRAGQPLEGVFA
jgi:hypothetical protein